VGYHTTLSAFALINVRVLNHIVARDDVFSFAEKGLL
jgi:DNA repair protein RadC